MKAYVRARYGGPEVLELRDVDVPVPHGDRVLVRVRAVSVTTADLDYLHGRPFIARVMLRSGLRRPRITRLGIEVAGVVEAVGDEVSRFRPGDEVFGDLDFRGLGGFAEYACASERAFARKPVGTTFVEAACLAWSGVLALQGLGAHGGVRPGDRVLINGASGSVGTLAVQIAKGLGAEVTGVCSAEKVDLVRSLGADHVVDYTRDDYTRSGRRYDRIFDVSSHGSVFAIGRALAPGGTYLTIGGSMPSVLQAWMLGPLLTRRSTKRIGMMTGWKPMKPAEVEKLTALVEAGSVRPIIDRTYPFAQLPQALREHEARTARGRVVVTV